MPSLKEELESLINKHSRENTSNTPDWVLASYLSNCLDAFDEAVQQRETFHGRDASPKGPVT